MSKDDITADFVRQILHYDEQTGDFFWKVSRGNQYTKPGMKAGFKDTYGHLGIEINGKRYLSHRLAWLYVFGHWPKNQIDHINRIRDDNKLSNLRDVEILENLQNKGNYKNNTSGYKGVVVNKSGKFIAQITINGKSKYLGSYKTPQEASDVYQNAFEKSKK